ncbi:dihydrofolate reductase family protein [Klenkia taihuensis]|nr:dihydrofolate reductase family protein [Klenkia taihuensis]
MRRVIAYELLSLDGVAESPDQFIDTWDDVLDANLAEVISTQTDVLLGRRSHDEWAHYWPTSDVEPFATFINALPKHVATSSPLPGGWRATAVEGDPVPYVRALRAGDGGDIGVHASISLVQTLLAADLVDELRLVVAPAVAGSGRRLLDGVPATRLELARSVTTPTGHLLLTYRPRRPVD